MRSVPAWLKARLPAKLSYRLRVIKALLVDSDLQALEKVAKEAGSPKLVAIDVGANVGIYAAVLARHFGQVICVEPNPTCWRYLRKVLPKQCILVECALSEGEGMADLHVPILDNVVETTRGTISTSNTFGGSKVPQQTISVPMRRLDSVLAELGPRLLGRIGLLKVDVEGHEFPVFKGGSKLLTTDKPTVFAELEARHGTPVEEVVSYFESYGYTVAPLVLDAKSPANSTPPSPPTNYVFASPMG